MIASKRVATITAALLCLGLFFCGFIVYAADTFDTTKTPAYVTRLFGDEVAGIQILADQADWQKLLDHAQAKEWISADIIINGTRFSTVGIRTKGNSSLSMGRMGGSTEGNYSLQIKMNKYVKGQTYFGLDTFCVNNMMGDTTYMKDYIAYDIMRFIGVDAPLTNYAAVTVNGEAYGFGLMLERYDKAFLDRVYGTSAGQLYNVKLQMGMREGFEGLWQGDEDNPIGRADRADRQDWQDRQERQPGGNRGMGGDPNDVERFGSRPDAFSEGSPRDVENPDRFPDGAGFGRPDAGAEGFGGRAEGFGGGPGFGGFGGDDVGLGGLWQSGGGALLYIDEDIDSYPSIFDNAVFSDAAEIEKQRLVTAIKHLNEGTDLESYFDVDGLLRYFAAHTFVVNFDSYTSNMQQNYYIYERDGKLTILPWDYGLSLGGFQSSNASNVVNFPIDTPVNSVRVEDRPLLHRMLENDAYRARYHDYLRQIVEGYVESGLYERTIRALHGKIRAYVEADVSAFFPYQRYNVSLPQLIELLRLRAQSVKGQLDGRIPSTADGQAADRSSLVDASDIYLSTLGSMMGGGGGGMARQGMGGGGVPSALDTFPTLSDE